MPSETVKAITNATVAVFRKSEISGSMKWTIKVKSRRKKRETLLR